MSLPTRTPTKPCTAFFASASVVVSSGGAASLTPVVGLFGAFAGFFSTFSENSKSSASSFASTASTALTFTLISISFTDPSAKVIFALVVFSPASFVSTGVITSSFASCGRLVTACL